MYVYGQFGWSPLSPTLSSSLYKLSLMWFLQSIILFLSRKCRSSNSNIASCAQNIYIIDVLRPLPHLRWVFHTLAASGRLLQYHNETVHLSVHRCPSSSRASLIRPRTVPNAVRATPTFLQYTRWQATHAHTHTQTNRHTCIRTDTHTHKRTQRFSSRYKSIGYSYYSKIFRFILCARTWNMCEYAVRCGGSAV